MDETTELRNFVRRMQMIAGSLIVGVVVFVIVAIVVVHTGGPLAPAAGNWPLITIILVATALMQLPMAFVMPTFMIDAAVKRLKAGEKASLSPMMRMLMALNSAMITRMAMLEGAAFAATIAYMMEGSHLAWPGIVIPLALMMWFFPSESGCRQRLEQIANQLS